MDSKNLSMFDDLTYFEKRLLYAGLLSLVQKNEGAGFCNNDQGHPAYVVGASGNINYETLGDSPEHNRLFQMMHQLSVSLNEQEEDSPTATEYVFSWGDFCRIAVSANRN